MKKEVKPIAMRCNEKQFREIENILIQNGFRIEYIADFEKYSYLVNNLADELGIISNLSKYDTKDYNRIVLEVWNKKTFLEYCGISVVPKFEITKEQILELSKDSHPSLVVKLKEWFPEAFESEFVVGDWYKHGSGAIAFKTGKTNGFGFDYKGNFEKDVTNYSFNSHPNNWRKATLKEVEEALINEAKKRYKVGDYIFDEWSKIQANIERLDNFDFSYNTLFVLNNNNSKTALLCDGIWAEIIPTKTIKEAEELLNCKIV